MTSEQITISVLTVNLIQQRQALEQMDTLLHELLDRVDMLGDRMWRTRYQILAAIPAKQAGVGRQTTKRRPSRKKSVAARRASK